MTTRAKLLIGLAVGAGLSYAGRAWLRSKRRIELADRVVVVTGASSGLGLMCARYAAVEGANLVLAARDLDDLETAAEELRGLGARHVMAVRTDVTVREQCETLIRSSLDRHGRVDVLLNDAGTIIVGPFETMTAEDFERSMATNFWGAFYCSMAVLPSMRSRGFGRIANVVSLGGKAPVPHLAPYNASKYALTGLTKSMRAELAKDGVLVTGIYPGTMRTGGHPHAWVKGDQPKEYAMFSAADTIPGLSMDGERAARALWRGVLDGDAEVNIGWRATMTPILDAVMPNWNAELMSWLNSALPEASGPDADRAIRGSEIGGATARMFSSLVPAAGRPGPGKGD